MGPPVAYGFHASGGWLIGEPYGERSTHHPVIGRVLSFRKAEDALTWKRRQGLSNGWKLQPLPTEEELFRMQGPATHTQVSQPDTHKEVTHVATDIFGEANKAKAKAPAKKTVSKKKTDTKKKAPAKKAATKKKKKAVAKKSKGRTGRKAGATHRADGGKIVSTKGRKFQGKLKQPQRINFVCETPIYKKVTATAARRNESVSHFIRAALEAHLRKVA